MRPCLVVGLTLLFAPLALRAQEQDFSKVEIKVTKVAGNIYLLQGGEGGNMAASVGEDGIVLVDDEFAPLASKIAAALKNIGITDKPVRFVINTHYHFDHTGGNLTFANQGSRSSRTTTCARVSLAAEVPVTGGRCILMRHRPTRRPFR
jgi:glyoxylase-like metal-dependent hydrolase (beta-lactamase superfamily II)